MKYRYINLTGREIDIRINKVTYRLIPPCEIVLKPHISDRAIDTCDDGEGSVSILNMEIVEIPDEKPGTLYIVEPEVAAIVKSQYPDRKDFVFPVYRGYFESEYDCLTRI